MIFCRFEKIYRNKNCRVAMTTTYENTSCNSENIVACLVSGEGLLHACISSRLSNCEIENPIGIKFQQRFRSAIFI